MTIGHPEKTRYEQVKVDCQNKIELDNSMKRNPTIYSYYP
jgi:hypothetical protein